jgi:hypothetical protein
MTQTSRPATTDADMLDAIAGGIFLLAGILVVAVFGIGTV